MTGATSWSVAAGHGGTLARELRGEMSQLRGEMRQLGIALRTEVFELRKEMSRGLFS